MRTSKDRIFYLDGGAGRVLCAIPALESYALTHYNFHIITSLKFEFFMENPVLEKYTHHLDEENLFDNVIKTGEVVKIEPYFRSEYYNQECSLIQAFDLEMNGELTTTKNPVLYFSAEEDEINKKRIEDLKYEYKKKRVLVFQPFGASAGLFDDGIFDYTNRSFVMENVVDVVQLLRQEFLILWMGNLRLNISNHSNPLVYLNDLSLRQWAGTIKYADKFLGCDSVGQHLAKAVNQKSVVVIGSTYPKNISYPNDTSFTIFDVGKGRRVYEPIRITNDKERSETNQGVMLMNNTTIDSLTNEVRT